MKKAVALFLLLGLGGCYLSREERNIITVAEVVTTAYEIYAKSMKKMADEAEKRALAAISRENSIRDQAWRAVKEYQKTKSARRLLKRMKQIAGGES